MKGDGKGTVCRQRSLALSKGRQASRIEGREEERV